MNNFDSINLESTNTPLGKKVFALYKAMHSVGDGNLTGEVSDALNSLAGYATFVAKQEALIQRARFVMDITFSSAAPRKLALTRLRELLTVYIRSTASVRNTVFPLLLKMSFWQSRKKLPKGILPLLQILLLTQLLRKRFWTPISRPIKNFIN